MSADPKQANLANELCEALGLKGSMVTSLSFRVEGTTGHYLRVEAELLVGGSKAMDIVSVLKRVPLAPIERAA